MLAKPLDLCTDGKTVTGNCLLVTGQPALRRQELCTGFYAKRGILFDDGQKALQESCESKETVKRSLDGSDCNSILLEVGEAANSVGRSHSSEDVLRKQKRAKGFGYLVRSILEQPRLKRGRMKKENDKVITDQ